MSSILRVTFAALMALSFLSGCCNTRQCPGLQVPTVPGQENALREVSRRATERGQGALIDQKGETLEDAFVRAIRGKREAERKQLREAVSVRVLSLSGGGPKGAYGAGFLNGLAANTSTRGSLDYDIVSGISTGAIQATFVFLGPEYFGELTEIYYQEQWETYVPEKSKLSLLFCGNSLRRVDGFRARMEERYTTDEVIRKVAEVGEKTDRQLVIGRPGKSMAVRTLSRCDNGVRGDSCCISPGGARKAGRKGITRRWRSAACSIRATPCSEPREGDRRGRGGKLAICGCPAK